MNPHHNPNARHLYVFLTVFVVTFIVFKYNQFRVQKYADMNRYKVTQASASIGVECLYAVNTQRSTNVSLAWTYYRVVISWQASVSPNCSADVRRNVSFREGSVFRVQAFSNQELVTKTAEYKDNETYVAELLLTVPGRYAIMVMLTYINGDNLEHRYHVKPILKQIQGSPYNVIVTPNQIPAGVTRYCGKRESGTAAGRWVKCGNVFADIYPPLERCGPWIGDMNFDFDKIHGFRWLPYACQHHQYTNDQLKKCLARNGWDSIVFAGDSHMRYRAYHWVTRLYGACHSCAKTHIKMVFNKIPRIEWIFDARGTRLPLTFDNITSLPHEKYMHPKVRRSKFSKPFPKDAVSSSLFLLNFGHWVLRESTDLDYMRRKLDAYAESVDYLRLSGKKVMWINTVSLPWRSDQAVIDWRENTSPSRVRQFNELADHVMRERRIPRVDAFGISDGRVAATHDQTHFVKRLVGNDFGGVVENAITNAIINALCNPED
eukprot:gene8097-8965_t